MLSDLHYDSYQRYALDPISMCGLEDILWNADALILAGDLTNGFARNWRDVFQYLSEFIPPNQIYALPGNHDYYQGSLAGDSHLAEAARQAGAHFIQKDVLLHGDTRLVCCTFWTDFNLTGCPSPLELCHYIGRERGIGHCEEATFRRRHLEAAA
nr:metallophosphoesterase [uncultured Tateyamaria sp.]